MYQVTADSNKGIISFYVYANDFAEAVLKGLCFNSYGNVEVYSIIECDVYGQPMKGKV